MRQRRIWFGLLAMTAAIAVLLGRLAWIQVIDTASFSRREVDLVANSVAQREQGIELDSGRGQFVDRNGKPITGETVRALVVFPVRQGEFDTAGAMRQIASILHADERAWTDFYKQAKAPAMWSEAATGLPVPLTASQAANIDKLGVPGVKTMDTVRRYPVDTAAKHAIGFIGQNPELVGTLYRKQLSRGSLSLTSRIGASGLEKTMESYLQGVGGTSVSLFTDGAGRPLPGLDVRLVRPGNPFYPLRIGTTLDLDIQGQVERILDKAGIASGAAVVLDAEQADVLAMASRPDFDPYRIAPGSDAWGNKALKAIPPGSIFKTVVAAAALEQGVVKPGEMFECNGSFGKYGFTCWLHGGHGHLTLEQAYAQSCNVVFAKVMQRLSGAQLQAAACQLGLDRLVGWSEETGQAGWSQFDAEERGQVFHARTPSEDEGIRIQTAIGQRDVLVSPLQAANLVVTLLHGGEVLSPRIVKDVRYATGGVARVFADRRLPAEGAQIAPRTANTLLKWMQEVVSEGTGQSLQRSKWRVAGKSGTAQTTVGGHAAVHQWFIGYGPVERPRYAVAVVAENEPENGANRAIAAFRDIMDVLAEQ
ncbi:peptidoglycan D,D-transpeptidase FtsI family protein [Paenibacillus hodogayensis]|uniref:Peptidoglycan D,D-transpeptidase FtsI family protein n=1 Tax=Paenibacillus hodogayensis TaxID=279208 RepID=A0ABV5VVS9_9BACL